MKFLYVEMLLLFAFIVDVGPNTDDAFRVLHYL